LLVGTDIDSNLLTYGITGGLDNGDGTVSKIGPYGVLTVVKATGAYHFVANDLAIEALKVDTSTSFTVKVSDGLLTGTSTLTINIAQNGITESSGNDKLIGTAGDNKFIGLAGNDEINGMAGADIMKGGSGNDTYFVDNIGDVVTELSALLTEIDKVNSSITYTLKPNVENLTLTGTDVINGSGNSLDNVLVGNSAANTLNGGLGNDTLAGGNGADVFRFSAALTDNVDTITDFNVVDDMIKLENSIFTALTKVGALNAVNFVTATAAADGDDFVIYDDVSGTLWYDADGNGASAAVQFAVVGVGLALTSADFLVI
jgi:Ca2+-binding RTX toxin-like protein